jgi:hypothetical protein
MCDVRFLMRWGIMMVSGGGMMRVGVQYFAGRRRSRVCWQITNNTLLLFRLLVVVVDDNDGGGDGNGEGTQRTTASQTSSFD